MAELGVDSHFSHLIVFYIYIFNYMNILNTFVIFCNIYDI